MSNTRGFYDLLEIPEDATSDEIRRAYHEAARKYHPDINVEPKATELFLLVHEAYDVLSDPQKRVVYDAKLAVEHAYPVSTHLVYSRDKLTVLEEPQLLYTLVEYSATNQTSNTASPAINVCLILDRSTSMQGERMDTVKTAAIELVRQLHPEDLLSIVVFNDRAESLFTARQRQDRSAIETQIRMIRTGGGTEIFRGLEAGYAVIRNNMGRSLINHMILLTDGRTYGDEDACLKLADHAASQGVQITGLGIGNEWNDVFLDELTTRTGGASFYISKTADIRVFLDEKFAALKNTYAERVSLAIENGPGVSLSSIYRLQPDATILPPGNFLRLGSIPKTSHLSILLEFIIPPIPRNINRFLVAAGELKLVLPGDPNKTHRVPIKLSRLAGEAAPYDLPPKPIFQALSQITLYRMQERARQEVAEGKTQEASQRLQRLATQLLSLGEHELAQTAKMEAERIQQTHMFSSEGDKAITNMAHALYFYRQILRSRV